MVIVIVLLVAVGGIVAAAALMKTPPNMTITNFQLIDQRGALCYGGGPVVWQFTLVNTGGAGFALVDFLLDGSVIGSNRYYVGANTQSPFSDTNNVPDCNAHTGSMQIASETPA